MSDYEKVSNAVIAGNLEAVKNTTQQALDNGLDAGEILDKGLLPAMDIVGSRMKSGEMFIPEVLRAAQSMQGGLDILLPLMGDGASRSAGTVVLGTVEGDLHDIGKNLVAMMLKGAGFKVVDLGTNVTPAGFVDAIQEHNASLVGLSALLTTTMPKMEATVKAITEAGLRDQVKILAGGAPVNTEFVEHIHADAYAPNAAAAVDSAKALVA